ncbi:RDD family protein [Pseudomonas sp. TKO26]|uniref:RDD family protein n=1 Tax=unclassified Pseudomonas TaxID=196821 RepID=UPI000D8A3D80|nr:MULTISPECIES: RDD family protein [unclassified Pseudomonas]PYY87167.1 RDD family protein [Pseudomonas sp. TKO30]PYY90030.1 RDD family protein [Pseudomonas sp. TKO29]PYY93118.1 RDD family protein [Pseudomonas sp. TKO26]PYZ00248.1 RDD family protein [Pseudomonas sp. TKO14]
MEVSRAGLIIRRILAYLLDAALVTALWFFLCTVIDNLQYSEWALLIIWCLYFPLSEYLSRGYTVGKALCGLQVINGIGQPPSLLQVLIRSATRPLEAAIGPVTLLICCESSRFQRIGDRLARTYVIARKDLARLRDLTATVS